MDKEELLRTLRKSKFILMAKNDRIKNGYNLWIYHKYLYKMDGEGLPYWNDRKECFIVKPRPNPFYELIKELVLWANGNNKDLIKISIKSYYLS